MIKYQLKCNDCNLVFDSWFASSKEFEKLKKKKLINCHKCNSLKIEKSLMKPSVINKGKDQKDIILKKVNLSVNKKIKEYQNFIKKNFDYVGSNFAYEARSIHYNKKKRNKGIFGKVSNQDLTELKEEGIKTQTIPWFDDKSN